MSDKFNISEEFYDEHEMEFFIISKNSMKKFESELDKQTKEFPELDKQIKKFRDLIKGVRTGNKASQPKIAEFMQLDVIKCLWSTSGTEKCPSFANSNDLGTYI